MSYTQGMCSTWHVFVCLRALASLCPTMPDAMLLQMSSQWDPAFRVGFEFRQGGAEMVQFNAIRFKPRLFYKNIGIEVCGGEGCLDA